MNKIMINLMAGLLFAILSFWGCSGNSGEESEKGAIRKMTDEVAHDLAHKIRNPIDKARSATDQEQDRLDDLEDTAEESSRAD